MTTTAAEKAALLEDAKSLVLMAIGSQRKHMTAEDFEELESDCLFAASRAIDDYDTERGAKVATLIFRYAVQARLDFFRDRRSVHGAVDRDSVPFSCLSYGDKETGDDPIPANTERSWNETRKRDKIQAMEITIDMARNDNIITEREYRILTMRRQNYTQGEAAIAVGISRPMAAADEKTAIAKIRLAYNTAE